MKFIYEFIGTFFLVLTVGMTVMHPHGAGNFAPLAIGAALAVLVYAGAHISGAHYNPAVSISIFVRGQLSFADLLIYWAAQLMAGATAAYTTIFLKGGLAPTPIQLNPTHALLAEFLFTFALCYVVLNVATAKETKGNPYFGFAIGFIVLAGAYAVGAVSGGAFNPAVAFGITLMNLSIWSNIWIYLVGNLLGGVVAALIFKATHTHET